MRKFIKKTLTTVTALLVVVTASSVASEGFTFVPEENTGIVVENDFGFDGEENEGAEVMPCSDLPNRGEPERPLS